MSLAARALAFGFRGRPLGEGFETELRAGEVACLIGPNGSGKTTLLRTLLGVLPRLAGSIVLDGRDIASYAPRERATRIAYLPQAAASDFDFSVEEIVEMGRTAHRGAFGRPGERDRRICGEALERLGIAHLASRPIGQVSGGERQLALVARALATQARVLLMDEPTASLDFANQARVLDEVARLRDAGAAILFTTHHPDQALRIADHALLLRAGRLVAAGPTASAVNSRNLSALYGQPVDVIEVASGDERPSRVCVSRSGARFD